MDADALTLLRLLLAWGADEAIEDAPFDRLTPAPAPAQAPPRARSAPAVAPARALSRAPAVERAQAAAAEAGTLDALRNAIAAFDGIGLRDTATGPVPWEGDPDAGVLLIGPPPSAEEDRAGRLMAGENGAFLAAMLASIGLRDRVLVAPLIPWRPPGDRPPSPTELSICLPFLHRLVVLSRPRLAVLMGPLAIRALLGAERRPARGRFTDAVVPGRAAPLACLPMAAPAQVRADPAARRAAWAELRLLRRRIDQELTPK